jgi:hypothetical protein
MKNKLIIISFFITPCVFGQGTVPVYGHFEGQLAKPVDNSQMGLILIEKYKSSNDNNNHYDNDDEYNRIMQEMRMREYMNMNKNTPTTSTSNNHAEVLMTTYYNDGSTDSKTVGFQYKWITRNPNDIHQYLVEQKIDKNGQVTSETSYRIIKKTELEKTYSFAVVYDNEIITISFSKVEDLVIYSYTEKKKKVYLTGGLNFSQLK